MVSTFYSTMSMFYTVLNIVTKMFIQNVMMDPVSYAVPCVSSIAVIKAVAMKQK